jgi:hypothetical protein
MCRLTRRVVENESVRLGLELELEGGAVRVPEPAVSPHPCLLLAVANNNAWHVPVLAGTTTSPCSSCVHSTVHVHSRYCGRQTAFVLRVAECILTCLFKTYTYIVVSHLIQRPKLTQGMLMRQTPNHASLLRTMKRTTIESKTSSSLCSAVRLTSSLACRSRRMPWA